MNRLSLKYLAYLGPGKEPATLDFCAGLNVICGASDTGKSFLSESIDFMLGQESPVRDIGERKGYDRIRIVIKSSDRDHLTLDRSVEGGHFNCYNEYARLEEPRSKAIHLRYKHSAAREDTLSHTLLKKIGLEKKVLRRNAAGLTRSLSIRDLARLCIVSEEEIQSRRSPFLSGQFTQGTAEYSTLKLLLTGVDDSALIGDVEKSNRRENNSAKIDLLNDMIEELERELDEEGLIEDELISQAKKLEISLQVQLEELNQAQAQLTQINRTRASVAQEIATIEDRVAEIDELKARFVLLDEHYESDLSRLSAIHESGSLFAHLEVRPCPLCGAHPDAQHLHDDCEGNAEAIVAATKAEIEKIERLRRELTETHEALGNELGRLQARLPDLQGRYEAFDYQLRVSASPEVTEQRSSYKELVAERADVRIALNKVAQLANLTRQRDALEDAEADKEAGGVSKTVVPTSVLEELSLTVQAILKEWGFPGADRVFFDEKKRDFQIGGKERGSFGKGLRAITHAAVKIGLMEYCVERNLPHPGFVVLDSPLLAYWKPEGDDDDLRGTDLKERFYQYLLGCSDQCQVIIVENEHPPATVECTDRVTVFTKNPNKGRYGFFPILDQPNQD